MRVARLARRLTAIPKAARQDTPKPPSLLEYVCGTVRFPLHEWQERYLIPLLQSVGESHGRRVLIHAPPQWGKSIFVSQRFPAWWLGTHPIGRVAVACYNIDRAEGFTAIIRQLVTEPSFVQTFGPDVWVSPKASASKFRTLARARQRDSQSSVRALGLKTGFTGHGVDLLIIDDPYQSDADAKSPATAKQMTSFWERTTRPRLNDETNVIVMFHRYHEEDFAGKLLAEGGWEYHRFPALGDANEDGSDPTGRGIGEPLSPIRSLEWIMDQKERDSKTFASQFQGKPVPDDAAFFVPDRITQTTHYPEKTRYVRSWDLALTEGTGDWTVGLLQGMDPDNQTYIREVVRVRKEPFGRNNLILETARRDGVKIPIIIPEDPGGGIAQAQELVRKLAGFTVTVKPPRKGKIEYAAGVASAVNGGAVCADRTASWWTAFKNELQAFPDGAHDDQVDALSLGYNWLAGRGEQSSRTHTEASTAKKLSW